MLKGNGVERKEYVNISDLCVFNCNLHAKTKIGNKNINGFFLICCFRLK